MEKETCGLLFVVIVIFAIFFITGFFLGILKGEFSGYKRGQVDAMNGTINYHLVTNADKTTEWQWTK